MRKGNGKIHKENGHTAGEVAKQFDKSPQALMVMATQERAQNEQRPAIEYTSVIHVLRTKGFSWNSVEKWFKARGVNLSVPTLYYAYQRAQARKPGAFQGADTIGLRKQAH